MTTPFGPWVVGFRGQIIPVAIFADIISDNWDGTIPPVLPDFSATLGYALDASAGSAQFNGPVFFPIGDVTIGGPNATDAQLFIDNVLQHLNLRETDDPSYPQHVFIMDINSGIGRLFWFDTVGPTFTEGLEVHQDGHIVVVNGPLYIPEGAEATPGLAFGAATTDGIFHEAGIIGVSLAGSRVLELTDVPAVDAKAPFMRMGLPAYTYKQTVVYTANNTFMPGDYDGFRIALVKVQAGGGGGGGSSAPAAGSASIGGAGGGGGYSESWVPVSDFDVAGEAVTVGSGGAGGAAGNNNGGAGTASTVDTISGSVTAAGGGAGQGNAAFVPLTGVPGNPGSGGTPGGGSNRNRGGDDGSVGFALAANRLVPGIGGGSEWAASTSRSMVGGSTAGPNGANWGGGALGGFSVGGGAASAGGAGGAGRVEIDIYT